MVFFTQLHGMTTFWSSLEGWEDWVYGWGRSSAMDKSVFVYSNHVYVSETSSIQNLS